MSGPYLVLNSRDGRRQTGDEQGVLYMGAMMTAVMLAFMLGMYRNSRVKTASFGGSAVLFVIALYLARSHVMIGDVPSKAASFRWWTT